MFHFERYCVIILTKQRIIRFRGNDLLMVYFIIIFIILTADLLSKHIIKSRKEIGKKEALLKDRFFIWHVKNSGVAYNFMSGRPKAVLSATLGMILAVMGVFIYALRDGWSRPIKLGLTFILGGALGNFIDRAKNKCVTDFIYIKGRNLPIFNIADIFVFLGSAIIAVFSFFDNNK